MSREMKDSGVAWIGEIPKGWGVSNVGKFFHIILGKMLQPNRINENDTLEKYLCAANVGKNTLSLNEIKEMWFTEKEKEQYALQKGDLLVVEGGDVASSAIININVTNIYIQNALHRVRAKFNDDIRFLRYMLTASKAVGHIDLICNKATIAHFTKDKFSKLTYLIPPSAEQQSIANYLDEKCAEIDNLISLLEEMIGELKAYKQSVITETVCKGLNKNAPMKDSGIEWIGEIPKNWGVAKIKNFVAIKNGKEVLSSEGDIPVYGSGGVFGKTNNIMAYGESVLMGRKGTIDKPKYISEGSPFWCVDTVFYTSKKPICHMMYFYYCVSSIDYNEHIYGTALPSMTQTILNNINMPFPALTEQQSIASYLDEKCGNIEGLIAIKQAKIDELKEFKKSLIYEYVTGKKSVI